MPGNTVELVDGFNHVNRDTDRARLVRDRTRDGLANPPGRVGRKLVTSAVLEFIHGFHQADIAFLDQVEELQTAVGVLLGYGDHQPEVGFDHFLLGATRLGLANRHGAVDILELGDRDTVRNFATGKPGLHFLDIVNVFTERRHPFLLALKNRINPFRVRLVIMKALDESELGHLGLAHRHLQDGPFMFTRAGYRITQPVDQVIHHLGR